MPQVGPFDYGRKIQTDTLREVVVGHFDCGEAWCAIYIRTIILLRPGSSGALEATILYESPRKKKKDTRALQPLERVARRVANAQRAYWDTLVERHDRSNEKKRDGWARDGVTNLARATRKSAKQLVKGF